jgi:DNA-binding response OmpR family regulator
MDSKKKILVVEDEEILSVALSGELKDAGFEVAVARDGIEGVKKAASENPDLILLDLVMPRLDGIGALKQIRENTTTKEIPVVILSNLSDSGKVSEALSLGAMDFLVKANYRIEELIAKIKTVLDNKPAATPEAK